MLKRIFYASAAVLMLALAYHFGASTATAQGGAGHLDCFGADQYPLGGQVTVVINRMMTTCISGSPYVYSNPVPGTGRILACAAGVVLLDTGEVYAIPSGDSHGAWELRCVFSFDSPTSVRQETWGAIKSRYRGERGAAQSTPGVTVTPGADNR